MTEQPENQLRTTNARIVTLDVREDIRAGREPFSRIMSTVAALNGDEQFRLIVPFQPVPLFEVMKRRGFTHGAQMLETGDWEVLFTRAVGITSADAASPETARPVENPESDKTASSNRGATETMEVDVRGMEPPQPLVVILESISVLPVGATLCARTSRRPIHLYAHLEERGFVAETVEQSDGSFLTYIRRR
jgi:uncharacterized protein (DUF2249 family)